MTSSNPIASQLSPLRIVIFRVRRHAEPHARAILRYAGAELVAVADALDTAGLPRKAMLCIAKVDDMIGIVVEVEIHHALRQTYQAMSEGLIARL